MESGFGDEVGIMKKLDISAYRKNLDLTLGDKWAVVVFALQFRNVEMVKLLDGSLIIISS